VLRRVTETFQASRPEGIRWSLQLYNNLSSVRFDEAKVQQAFVKVIENAVEATGGEGTIGVETRNVDLAETVQDGTLQLPPGAYVCVEVTDDGPGIEPEVLPRIFEPFYTTKAAHRGLGLAWVNGVITNHGGGVALSSMPGQGTSVRIYLPAGKAVAPDTRIRGDLAYGEKNLLFVDDEELVLTMGQAILESQGYRVLAANTGEKALEILARHEAPIDLVITDLVMPQMSGRELIEQIRFFCPDTPIICTSGYVRPASPEDQAIYLQKPFTAQELLRRVSEALETAEAA
jgi:CheY-like chemotaxis protein